MSPIGIVLLVLLILVIFGGSYGYRTGWYADSPYWGPGFGIIGLILLVLLVMVFLGRW